MIFIFFSAQKSIATSSNLFPKIKQQPFFIPTRGMFIQTQDTPNPNSVKFLPGVQVSRGLGGYLFPVINIIC